jgi:hypothetical protein
MLIRFAKTFRNHQTGGDDMKKIGLLLLTTVFVFGCLGPQVAKDGAILGVDFSWQKTER